MSSPVPSGAELTDAALDEWVANAESMAARYQQLRADVEGVSVTETTPDGMISVTVNSAGLMTDLRIAERATDLPAAKIAAGVMSAMRRAQSRIAGQVAEVMKSTVGDDTAMADAVLTRYQATFPPPPEPAARPAVVEEVRIGGHDEPPSPSRPPVTPAPQRVAPARAPVRGRVAAEDFDGGSFLEEVDR
jgi:DNA-binding protein YbaB